MKKPTINTPVYTELNPDAVTKLKEAGVDMKKYDPSKPTFFPV